LIYFFGIFSVTFIFGMCLETQCSRIFLVTLLIAIIFDIYLAYSIFGIIWLHYFWYISSAHIIFNIDRQHCSWLFFDILMYYLKIKIYWSYIYRICYSFIFFHTVCYKYFCYIIFDIYMGHIIFSIIVQYIYNPHYVIRVSANHIL